VSATLEIDLALALRGFELCARWNTAERFLGLFGPSGAGKSTILQAIAGLRRDVRGIIRVGGETWLDSGRGVRVAPEARGCGYVPQEGLLFPHWDVEQNVLAGAERASSSGAASREPQRVFDVLELNALRSRSVTSLSGGERQRVALARALCSGPKLLLLDEPLASLDVARRQRILAYLVRVREEFAIPTLHVSHDAGETLVLCDEVLVLDGGKAVAQGAPREVLADPTATSFAREEGVQNVLRGPVAIDAGGTARLHVGSVAIVVSSHGVEDGRQAIFALRADDVVLAVAEIAGISAQNDLPGVVREIRGAADDTGGSGELLVTADADGGLRLVAAVTPLARARLELVPGRRVRLVFKAHACRLLTQI